MVTHSTSTAIGNYRDVLVRLQFDEEGNLELTKITGILPANTAVIVKATPGNYTFTYTTETATVENNDLRGTLYNKNITEEAYVLGKDENDVAYLGKAVMTDGAWLNNANKAYLPVTAGAGARFLSFDFGTETAIESVESVENNAAVYDLSGRRVQKAQKGLYIVNGKKVVK